MSRKFLFLLVFLLILTMPAAFAVCGGSDEASAVEIAVGVKQICNQSVTANSYRWYKFITTADGTIKVEANLPSGKYGNVYVYDTLANQKLSVYANPSNSGSEWLKNGTYYVKAGSWTALTGFNFTVTYTAPFCGDGHCTDDDCAAGCKDDCSVWQCSSNSKCDTKMGENCQSYASECPCPSGKKCLTSSADKDERGCVVPVCGDDKCDEGECASGCKTDCNTYDCSNNGVCDTAMGETCKNYPNECPCPSGKSCRTESLKKDASGCAEPTCGDGVCDSGECASGCKADCKTYDCSNNGNCDLAMSETCSSAPSDCPCSTGAFCSTSDKRANERGCVAAYCGDGTCDSSHGETQQTCCKDCSCYDTQVCDISGNACVECTADIHCKQEGKPHCDTDRHVCRECVADSHCGGSRKCDPIKFMCSECVTDADCPPQAQWRDEYECDMEGRYRLQAGVNVTFTCNTGNGNCVEKTSTKITKRVDDCYFLGKFCQSGKCGCDEGYNQCNATKECERIAEFGLNNPCSCDFQCISGYCDNRKCVDAITVTLSSAATNLEVGKSYAATWTVQNNLNQPMTIKLSMEIGSGVRVSSAEATECSGNTCIITATVDGMRQKSIEIMVAGTGRAMDSKLAGTITYRVGSETYTLPEEKKLELRVFQCGDGRCDYDAGESSSNCCTDCRCGSDSIFFVNVCDNNKCRQSVRDVFLAVGLVFAVLLMATVIARDTIARTIHDWREHDVELMKERARLEAEVKKRDLESKRPEPEEEEESDEKMAAKLKKALMAIVKKMDRGHGVRVTSLYEELPDMMEDAIDELLDELVDEELIEEVSAGKYRLKK